MLHREFGYYSLYRFLAWSTQFLQFVHVCFHFQFSVQLQQEDEQRNLVKHLTFYRFWWAFGIRSFSDKRGGKTHKKMFVLKLILIQHSFFTQWVDSYNLWLLYLEPGIYGLVQVPQWTRDMMCGCILPNTAIHHVKCLYDTNI